MMNLNGFSKALFSLLLLAVVILTACDLIPGAATPQPATTTPEPATPVVGTPNGDINTPSFQLPEPTIVPKTKLIIWLPPEIASRTEAGAVVFSDQLLAFNGANPDLEISVEQKSVGGQGGILNYLRTGKNVAQTILPDLIAIPVSQITAVSDEGLIIPMEDVIDPDTLENLYPVAQSWAIHKDHIVAYPFSITEIPQLEYNSTITETASLQWSEFISNTNRTMVLPATGPSGAKLALQFYLQAGGTLENDAGQPALEVEPLTLALQQLYEGRQNGFILQQSSNINTIDEGKLLLLNGTTDYALSASDEFLKGRTEEITPGFSTIPGLDGSPTPLVHGWAWAITTSDPAKKTMAANLMTTLTSAENLGSWSLNSKILPANPNAFNHWPEDDPFITLANQELQRAEMMPLNIGSPTLNALENAVFDVVSLLKTPEDAAAESAASLQP